MISKELFCKTIADVQEQNRKILEFNHALGKICDSTVVGGFTICILLHCSASSKKNWTTRRTPLSGGCMRMSANASGSTSKMVAGCATTCLPPNPCMTT